jgi:hypothetical protein
MDPATPPAGTETQPPPQPELEKKPAYKHGRTGNVARLPRALRDQVCEMILDGLTYRQIIENLGDAGKDLNEGHITSWKGGGYKDWILETQRVDDLGLARDAALSLVRQDAGGTVQDAGRTIAATQLYELLLSFNPKDFASAIAEKPELYFRMVNSLSRLSEGEGACSRRRAQKAIIQEQLTPGASPDGKRAIPQEQLKQLLRLVKLL